MIEFSGIWGHIFIEPRPPACRRGRYIARLLWAGMPEWCGVIPDGWPKFYPAEATALHDVRAWLKKHNLEHIEK